MNTMQRIVACAALLAAATVAAADPAFDDELLAIQQEWATANYQVNADAREPAFANVEARTEAFAKAHPERAEAWVWAGIVQSSHGGAKGRLGALGLTKKARASLEAALKLDSKALDGSAYTSLGTLYYKVPRFPIGIGDHDKARELLQQALVFNPNGIDPNYFYGEYLHEQGQYREALQYLDRAAHAPRRPGRELADQARRNEIAALAARVKEKLG